VRHKGSEQTPISDEDRQLVEVFWKEFVDGYMFNDLENCVRLAHANYMVALGEMCYIDFFGKLMTGKERASYNNFTTFVKEYLPTYATNPLDPKDAAFLGRLYGEFRSGLVHSYFPKNVDVVAVMKVLPNPPSIWQESGKWKIVVADFLDELKKAAYALRADLLAGKYLENFKEVIAESPGMDKITQWPSVGGGTAASTTVTTFSSGAAVFPPKSEG
jgi:hypothetical protein